MPTVCFPHSIGRPDRYRKAESYPPTLTEKEKWLSEKTSSCYWALTSHSDTFLPLAAAMPSARDILKASMLPKKHLPWMLCERTGNIFFLGLSRVLPLVEVICTFLFLALFLFFFRPEKAYSSILGLDIQHIFMFSKQHIPPILKQFILLLVTFPRLKMAFWRWPLLCFICCATPYKSHNLNCFW